MINLRIDGGRRSLSGETPAAQRVDYTVYIAKRCVFLLPDTERQQKKPQSLSGLRLAYTIGEHMLYLPESAENHIYDPVNKAERHDMDAELFHAELQKYALALKLFFFTAFASFRYL